MKINSLLAATLAFVLVAGLGTPAFADISSGSEDPISPAVISPQQVPNTPVDCGTDAGLDVVAIDVSKGAGWGLMQTLADDLVLNGFTVRTTDIETNNVPSCVVKLMINNLIEFADCQPMTPYSQTAIDRVVNFVNAGGAVLINHDNSACDNVVDPISAAFGIIDNSVSISPGLAEGTNYLNGNPPILWDGVVSWTPIVGTSFVPSAESVATLGVFPAGDGAMELREPGNGCVLASPDTNWLDDGFIGSNSHQQLALNVFLFLNDCIEDEPIVVGGQIIPIDATSLLLAGAQTFSWMIPVVLSGIGIGLFVVSRKAENS